MAHKKSSVLGMNFTTARGRLHRDILFKLVVEAGYVCYRCRRSLDRESFTVDHKAHWMQSSTPKKSFFDLQNIAFSHHKCNSGNTCRSKYTPEQAKEVIRIQNRDRRRACYSKESRHKRYKRTGW